MNSTLNSNYTLTKRDTVQEISSEASLYTHESGARILFLINDDDNKVFNISFKTPPEDDTGVAHIMEHSVLCGSKKYPVKEPFVELMKSSLNTFLNAMTYPDKTIYPVASRNHADFRNLVDVYLDAVFEPELAKEAFEQEGWHHEVNEDGSITYKGVVFNEMKGVFSSSESFLDLATNRKLFPDSSYHFESGGYPPAIPDLSYEQYLQFHREKYHPANSWIILYGDIDEAEWLRYLDEEYLCRYSKPDFKLPELISQPPLTEPVTVDCTYPAGEAETTEKNTLLAITFVTGTSTDLEKNFAMGVLDNILIGSSGSPLKKALLESGLAQDSLDYGYSSETLHTTWSVGLRDTDAASKQKFVDLVFSTLKKLADEGLPEKIVQASMNICEFQLREANFGSYPKGLVYSMNIMARWLYGAEPLEGIKYEPLLKKLKEKVAAGGYFEHLIREVFLNNPHFAVTVCAPDKTMAAQLEKAERERLEQSRSQLDEEDIEALKAENKVLIERQLTPDSQEALESIPVVSVEDLNRTVEEIPVEILSCKNSTIHYHDLHSQGICYLQLCFDTAFLEEENYPWMALLNTLLIKCGTKDQAYDDFTQDIACHTGGMTSSINIHSTHLSENCTGSHFLLQAKVMKEKTAKMFGFLKNIFEDINFNDIQRVKELVNSSRSKLRNSLNNNGDRAARNYLSASLSNTGYLTSLISGLGYFNFLNEIAEALEKEPDRVIAKLLALKNEILCSTNLIMNVTADKDVFDKVRAGLEKISDSLPARKIVRSSVSVNKKPENTALIAAGSVQYVVKGINIDSANYKNSGIVDLLTQLLSTGYLWEKIRVQGGAYGCYITFDKISGDLLLASYRDPNLSETVECYNSIAEYLENLEISQKDLDKLIIGTVGRLDSPLTTSQKGKMALNRYKAGVTSGMLNQRRVQLLNATVEDLRAFAPLFRELAENGRICVHGSEKIIKENDYLFDKTIRITD